MAAKRGQIDEIYLVRTLAILGVLMVHSTSSVVGELDHSSSYWSMYNFLNIFFKYGTPTFIFLSSFVLFYNYYNRPLDKKLVTGFYKKRLLYIIIPYLLFSVFYYWLRVHYYYSHYTFDYMISDFTEKLLTGKAYTHLYFVFISIQFYLLFPLLLWMFKRFPVLAKNAIWIGFALQWAFVLYNHYYLGYTQTGSLAISYMSYYFLGAFIGIYYNSIVGWLKVRKEELFTKKALFWFPLWITWIGSGSYHVYLWYMARSAGVYADTKLFSLLWNISTYTSAIVLLQIAFWIYAKWSPRIINIMIHLGVTSFGVYLFHPLVLFYYRRMEPISDPMLYHLWVVGGYASALFISWIVVGLTMKYFKYSWVIFGSAPKKINYKQAEQKYEEPPLKSQSM
ncbi:acyltransferase [Anaerobacillus sp. MEB173]|uniref:acyltransferase n=1 Tax=Anaerobacillus sp. MEB173 TaxID=3383345 RepID=UPI003F8EF540